MNEKKKFWTLKSILIFCSFIALVYSLILPGFIDLSLYQKDFIAQFKKKTTFDLQLGDIKIDLPLTGGIVLRTNTVQLSSKEYPHFLEAKNLLVKVKILPLLVHKISIANISMDQLDLEVSVVNSKALSKLFEKFQMEEDPHQAFKIVCENTDITLQKYQVALTNLSLKKEKTARLTGDLLAINDLMMKKGFHLTTKGTVNDLSSFSVDGYFPLQKKMLHKTFMNAQIVNFPVNLLGEYILPVIHENTSEASGFLNLMVQTRHHALTYTLTSVRGKPIQFPHLKLSFKNIEAKGEISLQRDTMIFQKNILTLDDALSVTITGDKKSQTLAFDNIRLSELVRYIPATSGLLSLHDMLDKFQVKGIAHGKIVLRNNEGGKPIFTGNIQAEQLKINHASGIPLVVNGFVSSEINHDKVLIRESLLEGGKNSKVKIVGTVNLNQKFPSSLQVITSQLDLNWLGNVLALVSSDYNQKRIQVEGSVNTAVDITGLFKNPKVQGLIDFPQIVIRDRQTGVKTVFAKGKIRLDDRVYVNYVKVQCDHNQLELTGSVQNESLDFQAKGIQLEVKELAHILAKYGSGLDALDVKGGRVQGNMHITGTFKRPLIDGNLALQNVAVVDKFSKEEILLPQSTLSLKKNIVNIYNAEVKSQYGTLTISGRVLETLGKKPKPWLDIHLKDFDVSQVLLNKFQNSSIQIEKPINGDFRLQGEKITGDIPLVHNKLMLQDFPLDVTDLSGNIKLNNDTVTLQDITYTLGGSKGVLSGDVKRIFHKLPEFNIHSHGNLHFQDIQKISPDLFNKEIDKALPFQANLYGNPNFWNANLSSDFASLLSLANIEAEELTNKNINLSILAKRNKERETGYRIFISGFGGKIDVDSDIHQDTSGNIRVDDLTFLFPKIYLRGWQQYFNIGDLDGIVAGQVKVKDLLSLAHIEGFIKIQDGFSKNFGIKNFNAEFTAKDSVVTGNILNINLQGSDFLGYFETNPIHQLPIEVTKLTIFSKFADFRKFEEPVEELAGLLPFYTNNMAVTINKAYMGNIILDSIIGEGSITTDGNVNLGMLAAQTAGGTMNGVAVFNVLKPHLFLEMTMNNIQANAAATALLDIRNELFGTLKGKFTYETSGIGYDAMLNNLTGSSTLIIQNGKFLRLGTMEHLLTATNILGGGLTGFNLNTVIKSLVPINTGNFQLLSGEFSSDQGILKIDSLKTLGEALNLSAQGTIDLVTNDANIQIEGSISRDVRGALGPLGNLSLNKILEKIPGLGYITVKNKKRAGLIHYIPVLGYIPFLGRSGSRGKAKKFGVSIVGDLYDNKSVKNFHWIR